MKETKFKQTLVQTKDERRKTKESTRHCEERSDVAIQSGFKMTEVGMIPNDWEVKPFKNVATLINGRAYSQNELLERGKYRVLRVGNFGTNDSWYYSNLELPEKMYCNKGDLLYCWSCTYGAYIWDEEKTIYHYHIWKIADLKAEKRYLQYILNNDVVQQMNSSNGSTMSHITKGFLENRLFAFPPTIKEQQRIANALSDVDTLIANLEKLIAKKKNIKQGAMQQLLTGRKRLPGFGSDERQKECHSERSAKREVEESSGYKMTELGLIPTDWEVKKIGDFCSVKDGTHGTYARHDKGCLLLSAKNILDNRLLITNDESFVSEKDYTEITANGYPQKGDILVSCVGSIGRCCILETDEKIAFQRSVAFVRNKSASTRFLMYAIQGESAQAQLEESKNASTLGGVYLSALADIELMLPTSLDEQTAIANVLSDMDSEISALETKLAKYRTLKTGMMQQLLTGKIRLV